MRLRVVLFCALVLCIVPMVALPAHAASQIVTSGGGGVTQTFSCPASPAPCVFSTTQGVFTFSINIGTQQGYPPSITLDSLNSASSVPADLQISYSVNNLTAPASAWTQHFTTNFVGASTSGTYRGYYDASNTLGGTATLLAMQSLSGAGALSTNTSGSTIFTGPYTLTQIFNLHDTVLGVTQQLTGNITMIPEPATLSLLGAGFLGFAMVLRKKVLSKQASNA